MQVLTLNKKTYPEVLRLAVKALKAGKTVVYPTDTSYALGAAVTSAKGIKQVYKVKSRTFRKPIHLLVRDIAAAKKLVYWNSPAQKLARKFLPGPLSLVLPLRSRNKILKKISAASGFLGFRVIKSRFANDLVKRVGPLTATSANPPVAIASGYESYSASDVIDQFKSRKHKPDIIVDAGILKKIKPSTFVKINKNGAFQILRLGPISAKKIQETLR